MILLEGRDATIDHRVVNYCHRLRFESVVLRVQYLRPLTCTRLPKTHFSSRRRLKAGMTDFPEHVVSFTACGEHKRASRI